MHLYQTWALLGTHGLRIPPARLCVPLTNSTVQMLAWLQR